MIHQWVDVFTRKDYSYIFFDYLKFCQKKKGLEVYAWVIMSNHCHMILGAKNENLSDVIRDLKKFASRFIYKAIEESNNESSKNWLLRTLKIENRICFWEEGYHGEEIENIKFFNSKVNYIHLNPVRTGIVEKEKEYLNSSAGDFYGVRKGRIDLLEYT